MLEQELQKSVKKVQEAMALAAEESVKCNAAKEVIKSLTTQLKDMAEKLPPGSYDPESLKLGLEPNGILYPGSNGETNSRTDQICSFYLASHPRIDSATSNGRQMPAEVLSGDARSNESNSQAGILYPGANAETNSRTDQICSFYFASHSRIDSATSNGRQMPAEVLSGDARSNESNSQAEGIGLSTANRTNDGSSNIRTPNGGDSVQANRSSVSEGVDTTESGPNPDGENGSRSGNSDVLCSASQIEAEWIEQYEPGVYITLVAFRDGTRDLKRVRFSWRRFGEHQAETWWSENREKVYMRYNVRGTDKSSVRTSERPLSSQS